MISRRQFVSGMAGAAAGMIAAEPAGAAAAAAKQTGPMAGLANQIVKLFQTLPGQHALYIVSPQPGRDFEVSLNPDAQLFCASAFKGFVLAKYLQMVDAGEANLAEPLAVDPTIWSPGSPVLTPFVVLDRAKAGVVGTINARTALDAMISRSDNTATDIMLKHVGADHVRQFIASIGLQVRIPDSTKQFTAYVAGLPNWQNISWEEAVAVVTSDAPPLYDVLNPVQTMAASPREFVSFYSRALQGEFFSNPGILTTFRAILSQSEAIPRSVPLGVNAFIKGGSLDFGNQHALSLAGGLFVPARRWVYFGAIINWTGADTVPVVAPQFGAVLGEIFRLLQDRLGTA